MCAFNNTAAYSSGKNEANGELQIVVQIYLCRTQAAEGKSFPILKHSLNVVQGPAKVGRRNCGRRLHKSTYDRLVVCGGLQASGCAKYCQLYSPKEDRYARISLCKYSSVYFVP